MSGDVSVAVITVSGSIVVAASSFFLTKLYERRAEWNRRKIEKYTELLVSLSGIVDERGRKREAHERFADAANTIVLVAPQYVVETLANFIAYLSYKNTNKSQEAHDHHYKQLVLAIRKDIGVSKDDDPTSFPCGLVGIPPCD